MESVFLLKVFKEKRDYEKPYMTSEIYETTGTGFVIDIKKGYLLTNYHVISDSKYIVGRLPSTGKRDISIEVVSTCKERDLALCKIKSDEMSMISSNVVKSLKFGDSMTVKPGDDIYTWGYPLGSSTVKLTKGVVSGFETSDKLLDLNIFKGNIEDMLSRSSAYIQVSAPFNPGNSGGPIFNKNEEVVGIINSGEKMAESIAYVIPSRTFLSIYQTMLTSPIVKLPTLGLEWCPTSREVMKLQTGESRNYGIYIRKIYPDSCIDRLTKGDIIRRIDYEDIFWRIKDGKVEINKSVFDLTYFDKDIKENKIKMTVLLDRFGNSTTVGKLINPEDKNPSEETWKFETNLTNRKLELDEIMDMIPLNSNMSLYICRDKSWDILNTVYKYIDNERLQYISPIFNKLSEEEKYLELDHVTFSNLYLEHAEMYDGIINNTDDLFVPKVIILDISPESSAYKTQSLSSGQIVKTVAAYDEKLDIIKEMYIIPTTIKDIKNIIDKNPFQISITTTDETIHIFPRACF